MMILLANMMQSTFIFGFNVRFLSVRDNGSMSTDDTGQALANDVIHKWDSDRVIA